MRLAKVPGPDGDYLPRKSAAGRVSVDARHAAAASLAGKPEFHLTHCSRWPENAGCGRECLREIETSPENCLLHNILVAWYAGKNCAWCGRSIGDIRATERTATGLLPDQSSAGKSPPSGYQKR